MIDIRGKWALITGASRGIGRLCAYFLAEKGCNLILHSRNNQHTEALVEELKLVYKVQAYNVEAELTDFGAIDEMVSQVKHIHSIDILINNAGLQPGYRKDYLKTPISDYTSAFAVNTIAPMILVYRFLPNMQKQGFGRIVNITSGIDGEPEQAGYSAAKAGLNKVTKDIAKQLESTNVMINLADPGWCRTDLGGPNAPNDPNSALPGVLLGVFSDDKRSGRIFEAQKYAGMTLEEALHSDFGTMPPVFADYADLI